jgi:hypothetical protein
MFQWFAESGRSPAHPLPVEQFAVAMFQDSNENDSPVLKNRRTVKASDITFQRLS